MSMQSIMTGLVFALPAGILKLMAKPVSIGGHDLDPRIALMAGQAAKGPKLSDFDPAAARLGMQQGLGVIDAKPRANVATRDLAVPGEGGASLPARLYTPPGGGTRPLIVYFHQGGHVLGGLWTCHTWCSILAEDAGVAVLNVDYRHAPEVRFPGSSEDAIAAFEWARANAAALGADPAKIGVGGDSAGGQLAAVVAQAMKRKGAAQPFVQLLIYPAVDWTASGGSMETMANAYPLTAEMMAWFRGHYLTSEDEACDWRCSPALAEDVSGLAPALVYNAAFDPIADMGRAYADRLAGAGVSVKHKLFPSLSHSFTAMSGVVPAARAALAEIAADVKRAAGI